MEDSTKGIFDVIVAGAGPGGSTAAYYLGEAGLRVLVLEKMTFPRYKACGGATSLKLLETFPFSFNPVTETRIQQLTYAYKGQTISFPLPDRSIVMVMRDEFDQYLLNHTRAEVRQGTAVRSVVEKQDRVVVRTQDGKEYESRYLVGADGPTSIVARSLGLRRGKTLLAAIEVEAPASPAVFQKLKDTSVFIFGEIAMGYLWIFSKAEHLSVGIGALHPRPGELQSTLSRVMADYNIPVDGLPMHGHPVPIYTGREKISTEKTLLVGDAAGLVDPFSGEGISFAIRSGHMAAEAILSGNIHSYETRIQREIGSAHRSARFVAQVLYRYPGACFDLCASTTSMQQAISNLLDGHSSYAGLILRLAGSLPFFLVKRGISRADHYNVFRHRGKL